MDTKIAHGNIEKVAKQRNLFVGLSILSSLSCVFLACKLVTISEKTILVPGIASQFWIDGSRVSKSYLEESTLMYLSVLLDLNTAVIEDKSKTIFQV
jgi:hypothetical protein